MGPLHVAVTPILEVAYLQSGPADGPPAVLLHGFPYDVRSYAETSAILAESGMRVIVPYLRGYGETRFRVPETLRSGQQAAISQDLIDLLDALDIERAVVGGYDWGGRGACIAAAAHPERITGLVTVGGYSIQNIATSDEPEGPLDESNEWYIHYFQTERGREGLARNRDDLCRLLWHQWSPAWAEVDVAFDATAPSLHNPDFVDVAIHSYRHRRRNAPGDPRYDALEALLASQPDITVPTISLDALADGFGPDDSEIGRARFTGPFQIRRLPGVCHDVPQEAPRAFADAVLALA